LHPSETLDLRRVRELVIAGWTGRDVAALEKHIRELEGIGVKRPKTTPIFYRVAASLLISDNTIEVLGGQSSGEAECVVYSLDDGLFVGVGSDHTDRKAEVVGPRPALLYRRRRPAAPLPGRLGRRDAAADGAVQALLRRSIAGRHGNVLRHARRSWRHRAVGDI
jgi:hypothetical protein